MGFVPITGGDELDTGISVSKLNKYMATVTDENGRVRVLARLPSMFQDVVDFHHKYGIQYVGPPRDLPGDIKEFRYKRFIEEKEEIEEALNEGDLESELDGYVDLIYIILGTCHLHGWNFDEAWSRVHAANMKKERASNKNPGKYQELVCKQDIVKPPGWVAPDLRDLV